MQVSKVFIVHKHKSICNINDMFSCHFLGLVELVDFEHPTLQGEQTRSPNLGRCPRLCAFGLSGCSLRPPTSSMFGALSAKCG